MKLIPYGLHSIEEEDIEAVVSVLRNDPLTQGNKVSEFERLVADYHNCNYGVCFNSGTAALHGAYYAAGLKIGDEFITTPNTFVASANAGVYLGGIPILCDINPENFNIDISSIAEKITDKTRVITPVSYAGNMVDLREIYKLKENRNITIIHDAAHAIGARKNGYGICDYADMTMVSFHPVKHVATGEGGMILTNNQDLYKKLLLFRSHGIVRNSEDMYSCDGAWYYEMQELGYNYRISDILCALGISQMKRLKNSLIRRNKIAKIYNDELSELPWLQIPKNNFLDLKLTKCNVNTVENLHSYHLYPIRVSCAEDRKPLFDFLRDAGILVQVHYIPIHFMPYYQRTFGFSKSDLPLSVDFYHREISIPMFPTLQELEQEYVINKIKEYGEVR